MYMYVLKGYKIVDCSHNRTCGRHETDRQTDRQTDLGSIASRKSKQNQLGSKSKSKSKSKASKIKSKRK